MVAVDDGNPVDFCPVSLHPTRTNTAAVIATRSRIDARF